MANFKEFPAFSFQQIKMKYEDPSLPADTQSLSGFWKSELVWSLFTHRISKVSDEHSSTFQLRTWHLHFSKSVPVLYKYWKYNLDFDLLEHRPKNKGGFIVGVTQILTVCEVSEERQGTGDICYLRRRTWQIIMRSLCPLSRPRPQRSRSRSQTKSPGWQTRWQLTLTPRTKIWQDRTWPDKSAAFYPH